MFKYKHDREYHKKKKENSVVPIVWFLSFNNKNKFEFSSFFSKLYKFLFLCLVCLICN